jgi:hypothetical protein
MVLITGMSILGSPDLALLEPTNVDKRDQRRRAITDAVRALTDGGQA